MKKSKIKTITEQIITWSDENTAGTIMSDKKISECVHLLLNHIENFPKKPLTTNVIDDLLYNMESESGFLIKSNDFKSAIELNNVY